MIYEGLARVVTEAGRRRRLRSIIFFLAEELALENRTFEEEDALDEEEDSILVEVVDGEVEMMVEEAFIFSCLASLLITIVWYRIMPNQSFNFMCWLN